MLESDRENALRVHGELGAHFNRDSPACRVRFVILHRVCWVGESSIKRLALAPSSPNAALICRVRSSAMAAEIWIWRVSCDNEELIFDLVESINTNTLIGIDIEGLADFSAE